MDVSGDDRYHCKKTFGFFVLRDGKIFSPQFSVSSAFRQSVCVVVAPVGGIDVGIRLVLMHHYAQAHARALGFTSDKNDKLEYFFAGTFPFGKILIVPVEGDTRIKNLKPEYPFEDYVKLFEENDGVISYTRRAEEAMEILFIMLDTDNNCFLSRAEMELFKKFLGLEPKISDEEWCDILFGWLEGDLDSSLNQISSDFFKKFILRFCQGQFVFTADSWKRNVYKTRRDDYLERVFECFGFDKDLVPTKAGRYMISIYTERDSLGKILAAPRSNVSPENAVRSVTGAIGQKWENRVIKLVIYTLYCCDWFSVSVINYADDPREVMVDCSKSKGYLPVKPEGDVWRGVVPGHSQTVMITSGNVGSVFRIPLLDRTRAKSSTGHFIMYNFGIFRTGCEDVQKEGKCFRVPNAMRRVFWKW